MRFPPTIGVVGFDFGYKPAFSVAVVPGTRGKVLQQDPEDSPTLFCHDVLGDILQFATSGVLACSGCYALPNAFGPDRDIKMSLTGVNGTGTATWNGTSAWLGASGSATITTYASTDLSCSGASFDTTTTCSTVISCLGDNQMSAGIIGLPVTILGFTWSILAFDGAARENLGVPISNSLTSGDCGPVAFDHITVGSGGIITVTV